MFWVRYQRNGNEWRCRLFHTRPAVESFVIYLANRLDLNGLGYETDLPAVNMLPMIYDSRWTERVSHDSDV